MGFEEDIQQRIHERNASRTGAAASVDELVNVNLQKFEELAEVAKKGALLLSRKGVPMTHTVWVPRVTTSFWKGTRDEGRSVASGWHLYGIRAASLSLALTRTGQILASDSSRDSIQDRRPFDYVALLREHFDLAHRQAPELLEPETKMFLKDLESFRFLRTEPGKKQLLADELMDEIARLIADGSRAGDG